MSSLDISNIKLIIWDLDNTMWSGILSEHNDVTIKEMSVKLLQRAADCGIINSICSKNDKETTLKKLNSLSIGHLFVMPSINWNSKGERVKNIVETLGFRAENVIFIDDDALNRCEALSFLPGLMVGEPSIIPTLYNYYFLQKKSDPKHLKLEQYKNIEKREKERNYSLDNLDFLFQCDIQVEIHRDCEFEEQRIYELLRRTNQLNYTKNRVSLEEFRRTLRTSSLDNGYVRAKDKYGDYGIVGFFSVENNVCLHFFFSCRVIGLGIEDWVYHTIGKPVIKVCEPVLHPIDSSLIIPQWINQGTELWSPICCKQTNKKVLFKGPCDIQSIASYFHLDSMYEEFSYVSLRKNITIEHHNHSTNFLQFPFLSASAKKKLMETIPFSDEFMFDTKLFKNDIDIIFLSTSLETCLGIYRNKKSGYKLAWGEWDRPLTDFTRHLEYVNEQKSNYRGTITIDWLKNFSNNWEYIGRITPDEYIENLKKLFCLLNSTTIVCLILGCEREFSSEARHVFKDMHIEHKALNQKIREYAMINKRVQIIDFTDYVLSDDDFLDNINHFKRRVYFEAAQRTKDIVSEIA